MLRGGRSWPSETKFGAEAVRTGYGTAGMSSGAMAGENVAIMGGAVQHDAHTLHLSTPPWSL
jgi:hypothetical protein